MFGRFRKTNDPAQETDGGAVAVEERERAAESEGATESRRSEPATSVATPAAAPASDRAAAERAAESRRDEPATSVVAPAESRRDKPATSVAAPAAAAAAGGGVAARERAADDERDRFARTERAPVVDRDGEADDERRTVPAVVAEDTVVAMRARQRDRFGGIRWGSAFFGLLSAIGLAALILGIVAAAGVALGVSEINDVRNGSDDTIGLGGAILVVAVLALSWYCGGYVAGRMARFDGARQGVGVWVWTVVIGAVLAIAAVIGGNEYDVLQQLNLPNVAVGDESLTTTGLITFAAALVVTLVFAVAGGKAGDLFHRRVDRFVARDYVEPVA